MLETLEQTTENAIVSRLKCGSVAVQQILTDVALQNSISTRAVYKAIRKLIKEEVIIKHGKVLLLSVPWVRRLSRFTEDALISYASANYSFFSGLRDGRKVSFAFPDYPSFDMYWMHTIISLLERYEDSLFLHALHDIFIVMRPEAKSDLFQAIENHKRASFMLITRNTALDYEAGKKSKSDLMQVAVIDKNIFPEWPFGVIIGDFIIESKFEKPVVEAIEKLYTLEDTTTETLKNALQKIMDSDQTIRMVVTKNAAKASTMRRRMAKNFYIPKELRDKIN